MRQRSTAKNRLTSVIESINKPGYFQQVDVCAVRFAGRQLFYFLLPVALHLDVHHVQRQRCERVVSPV